MFLWVIYRRRQYIEYEYIASNGATVIDDFEIFWKEVLVT
jgi:hypothetical protein